MSEHKLGTWIHDTEYCVGGACDLWLAQHGVTHHPIPFPSEDGLAEILLDLWSYVRDESSHAAMRDIIRARARAYAAMVVIHNDAERFHEAWEKVAEFLTY